MNGREFQWREIRNSRHQHYRTPVNVGTHLLSEGSQVQQAPLLAGRRFEITPCVSDRRPKRAGGERQASVRQGRKMTDIVNRRL